MTLILITLAVILTTHLFGVFSPYPVSLTAAHCHSFWPEYIYGDFVHLSWYHLAVDSVAFVVIYALSPVDSILRTGRYASAYVLIFLVMNALLNWFIMSRFYPDGPVSAYYGISATEFTMLFMVAILWLYRRPVYGGVLLGISLLLVMMPFIMMMLFLLVVIFIMVMIIILMFVIMLMRMFHTFNYLFILYLISEYI